LRLRDLLKGEMRGCLKQAGILTRCCVRRRTVEVGVAGYGVVLEEEEDERDAKDGQFGASAVLRTYGGAVQFRPIAKPSETQQQA
jgi:hypothetical protein